MDPTDPNNVLATMMHLQQQEEENLKKAQNLENAESNLSSVPIGNVSEEGAAEPIESSIPANINDDGINKRASRLQDRRSSKINSRASMIGGSPSGKEPFDYYKTPSPFSWGDESDENGLDSQGMRNHRRSKGILGSLPYPLSQFFRILFFSSPGVVIALVILLLFKPTKSEIYSLYERHEGPLNWKMETIRFSLFYSFTVTLYLLSPLVLGLLISILKIIPKRLPGKLAKKIVAFLDYFLGTKSYWAFVIFAISFHILTVRLLIDNNPPVWKDKVTGQSYDKNPHPLLQDYGSQSPEPTNPNPPVEKNESNLFDSANLSNVVKTLADGNVIILHRLTKCLVVFAFLIAIEKSCIQVIGVRFHRNAFSSRINELKLKNHYFDVLYNISAIQEKKINGKIGLGAFNYQNKGNYDIESGLDLRAMDLTATENPKKKTTLASLSVQTVGFDDKSPEALEAIRKAKSIFSHLSGNKLSTSTPSSSNSSTSDSKTKQSISKEDFQPYFAPDIYEDVFMLFDVDGTGTISKANIKSLAMSLVQEEQDIKTSLRDHGQIVRKLDAILASIVSCIALVICLSFFQYSIGVYLASIGTFMLGFTFIFGGFAKAIFEDLVFLFITHPYDVGDALILNGEQCTVVNVDLLTSTFLRWDGQLIYVPTQSLITKDIMNIRRSGAQSECFDISISSSTPIDKVSTIKSKFQEQLKDSKKDYTGKVIMMGFDIDNDKMKLRLTVEHKTNFQHLELKSNRHNKIKMILREIVENENITYYNL